MKKISIIIVLLGLFFIQCTDLRVLPEDAFTEDQIFKDADAYRSYLAKLYGAFSLTGQDGPHGDGDVSIVTDEGFTSYIRAYWKAQELTTDEAVIAWTDAGIRDLHEHSWSSENQFMKVLYYRIALIVSIANDFIKQASPERLEINEIPADRIDEIELYTLEARYLRALAYWHTLDMFRNVPLVTEITADNPSQASPQELFDFIKTELEEIVDGLPDPRQNEYGRVDKAAVWMLQAKLFLNAEVMIGQDYYTECLDACNRILGAGYSLDSEYQQLFMADNHLSNEIIFALNADGKKSQSWGATTFLVYASIGGTMLETDYGATGGWAGLRTTSAMLDKFPDLTGEIDSRAIFYTDGQNIEINDIGTFEDGIAVPKYINLDRNGNAGSDPTHCDGDYPMFRLGDVYLMYAEAVRRGAQGGDINQAVSLVNELRERAYGNTDGNITADDLDLDFILDERVRELYWEATRRIDLVRFGKFTGGEYIWPWKGGVKEGMSTETHRDIFPIPADDLLANPELSQNPGY